MKLDIGNPIDLTRYELKSKRFSDERPTQQKAD